jgi:hypothetical protein
VTAALATDVDAPAPGEPRTGQPDARRGAAATLLVAATTAAYVAVTLRWVVAPIGLSHDGRNTAMFGLAARAMARLGPVRSHAGAVLADGNGSYAHHPPSLVWAIRAVQAVVGDAPWTARLPTFLASVAVIWLLFRLLQDLGVRSWPAAVATTVAVANPIFLLYGWMTDTPMWSLPFALVATRVWVRAGRGTSARHDVGVAIAAAAMCGLAGWQAVLWCGLLVLAGWRDRRSTAGAIAGGLALGLAASVLWIAASPAGVAGLVDSFTTRTTGEGQGLTMREALTANATYLRDLWSPLVLVGGPVALWFAARDVRVRRLLAVAVVGVLGYSVLFWDAAGFHDYWNLWAVVPVALAFGAALERIADTRGRALVAGALAAALLVVAIARPSDARARLEVGHRLGQVVATTSLPDDQPRWLLASLSGTETWISYVADRRVQVLDDRATLRSIAAAHPAWRIVIPCRTPGRDTCGEMGRGGRVVNGVAVTTASAALAGLG